MFVAKFCFLYQANLGKLINFYPPEIFRKLLVSDDFTGSKS